MVEDGSETMSANARTSFTRTRLGAMVTLMVEAGLAAPIERQPWPASLVSSTLKVADESVTLVVSIAAAVATHRAKATASILDTMVNHTPATQVSMGRFGVTALRQIWGWRASSTIIKCDIVPPLAQTGPYSGCGNETTASSNTALEVSKENNLPPPPLPLTARTVPHTSSSITSGGGCLAVVDSDTCSRRWTLDCLGESSDGCSSGARARGP